MGIFTRWFGMASLAWGAVAMAPAAFADDVLPPDSSTDLVGGFGEVVKSHGVMVRVPINAQGQENASLAEVRVDFSTSRPAANQLDKRWQASRGVVPAMRDVRTDSSTSADSSTHWGWGGWGRRWGWYNPGYYYGANFGFSYNNYYYGFGYPYYYDAYGYNCRYYYYPSLWYY